ncbi:hypothetical protein ACPSKX_04320 [Moritella viscosa]
MNKVKFLSSFVKRTEGVKVPVSIDIDSSEKNENEDYQTLLTSINSLLDFDNLIVLAGSGTSLTFTNIAPSMGRLWEKCKEQNPEQFDIVLNSVQYDKNQTKRDDTTQEPWNDIELLLSLCDQYIALFPDEDDTTQLVSFLEQSKKVILDQTNFTDAIDSNDWATHDKFIRILGRRSPKQQRLKLFTTNYDLAFEHSAANTGFVVVDGFEFSSPSYFNPAWYRYDIVDRSGQSKSFTCTRCMVLLIGPVNMGE